MNKVVLLGRLTKDPEIRTSQNNNMVANFSLAINRRFKNQNGEIEADFINCVAFNKSAEIVQKYVQKGNMLCVEGRLQTRTYDAQDGSKRYVTEVVCDQVELMPKTMNNSSSNSVNAYVDNTSTVYMDTPSKEMGVDVSNEDPYKDFGNEVSLSDDDLPF